MNTGSGGRDFRVGVELIDDRLCPVLYLAALVEAAVNVHAAERIDFAEHKAEAVIAAVSISRHRLRVASPCIGVCAASLAACERGVRNLGRLAITLFRAPTHPLP